MKFPSDAGARSGQQDLSKRCPALARFSAEIRQGEIVAIIGGSGCGKSTLLRAIAGLDRASSGTVTLDDEAIASPHAEIGIIFQEPRLLPLAQRGRQYRLRSGRFAGGRTAREGHACARPHRASRQGAGLAAASLLEGRRSGLRSHALVPQPEVLLLDEPFSALGFNRSVLVSLDRSVPDHDATQGPGQAMWW